MFEETKMTNKNINELVSIIVPVYNVNKYIEESMKSICDQSYENIEIIVVDDGSTDDSIEIAEIVLKESGRVYSIIHQNNKGLPAARNTGLHHAIGRYVCFIDSDDIIEKSHIKNSVEALLNHNALVCYSDYEMTYDDFRTGDDIFFCGSECLDKNKLFKLFSERFIKIHCCSLLIDRTVLGHILFNEKLRYGEDVEYMWRLFSEIDCIVHVKQKTYKYLQRDNSIMTTSSMDKWGIFSVVFSLTIDDLKNRYPEYRNVYEFVYNRTLLGMLNTAAKNCAIKDYLSLCDNLDFCKLRRSLISSASLKTRIVAVLIIFKRMYYYTIRATYRSCNRK